MRVFLLLLEMQQKLRMQMFVFVVCPKFWKIGKSLSRSTLSGSDEVCGGRVVTALSLHLSLSSYLKVVLLWNFPCNGIDTTFSSVVELCLS
jgi:hypothetical protein